MTAPDGFGLSTAQQTIFIDEICPFFDVYSVTADFKSSSFFNDTHCLSPFSTSTTHLLEHKLHHPLNNVTCWQVDVH